MSNRRFDPTGSAATAPDTDDDLVLVILTHWGHTECPPT